jgi:hypothetical protein
MYTIIQQYSTHGGKYKFDPTETQEYILVQFSLQSILYQNERHNANHNGHHNQCTEYHDGAYFAFLHGVFYPTEIIKNQV